VDPRGAILRSINVLVAQDALRLRLEGQGMRTVISFPACTTCSLIEGNSPTRLCMYSRAKQTLENTFHFVSFPTNAPITKRPHSNWRTGRGDKSHNGQDLRNRRLLHSHAKLLAKKNRQSTNLEVPGLAYDQECQKGSRLDGLPER
jgi:hypothetical protein